MSTNFYVWNKENPTEKSRYVLNVLEWKERKRIYRASLVFSKFDKPIFVPSNVTYINIDSLLLETYADIFVVN